MRFSSGGTATVHLNIGHHVVRFPGRFTSFAQERHIIDLVVGVDLFDGFCWSFLQLAHGEVIELLNGGSHIHHRFNILIVCKCCIVWL